MEVSFQLSINIKLCNLHRKILKMKTSGLISLLMILSAYTITLNAQTNAAALHSGRFNENDYSALLPFLSSDRMEGRETGTRGAVLASDFIAVMMQNNALEPFGDAPSVNNRSAIGRKSYFQNFRMIRYEVEKADLALINGKSGREQTIQFTDGRDYRCRPVTSDNSAEASVVFAGYGISIPSKGYDDYKGLDVNGKIVVVLKGFPGHQDTLSEAWKKLGSTLKEKEDLTDDKIAAAVSRGAIGVIYINNYIDIYHHVPASSVNIKSNINQYETTEPLYDGGNYILENDTASERTPCFVADSYVSNMIFQDTGIDPRIVEARIARTCRPFSTSMKSVRIRYSVTVKKDPVNDRNVEGIIYGRDTSEYIVVGAHYDHLGVRNGLIYNGADDNASGVAGMLALSKKWAGGEEIPPCNIIFAAWAAEEKGQLGSRHFMLSGRVPPGTIRLCINMDMISGSAPEDSTGRTLSIGTGSESGDLRRIAEEANLVLPEPFILDLWDVTGHSGSDYNYFSREGVPVMTFFSGYSADYHTTGDQASKTDLKKMTGILNLVNGCLLRVLQTRKPH